MKYKMRFISNQGGIRDEPTIAHNDSFCQPLREPRPGSSIEPNWSAHGIRAPFATSVAQRAAIGSTAAAWPEYLYIAVTRAVVRFCRRPCGDTIIASTGWTDAGKAWVSPA